MTNHRSTLCLKSLAAALAAGAFASVPAGAMQRGDDRQGEETFVDLGRWVIVQNDAARTCEMRLTNHPQVTLRYRMADGRAGSLALQQKSGRFFNGMVGDVTWSFDDARFTGYQSGGNYSLPAGDAQVESAFRSARTLYVSHGGNQLARIDLTTSSAGFRLLKQCSEQWRYIPWYRRLANADYGGRAAPPSRPSGIAPPLERPTLSSPVSARPINPASWISSQDTLPWPSRGFRAGEGVLGYTLEVDEEGRAKDCDVKRSTGSRRFDRQACRILIERARFEPARGSDGQPAEASYSASVRFADE